MLFSESRNPNSGSFVRPSANTLSYGTSFLYALHNKYIDSTPRNTGVQEKVTLGSSNGAIEIEAVGMDKIRGKFAQLDHLKELSLDNELVATANDPGLVYKTCPSEPFPRVDSSRLQIKRRCTRIGSFHEPDLQLERCGKHRHRTSSTS